MSISRPISPSAELISSAADAMLKLSGIALMNNSDANSYCSTNAQSENDSDVNSSSNDEFIRFLSVNKQCDVNSALANYPRKEREFIPENQKDEHYWSKRKKNNEAAKRSREKRRINDVVLNKKISELQADNKRLRLELEAIKNHFKLPTHISFNNPNLTPYLTYTVAPLITNDKSLESDSNSSVDGSFNGNIKKEKDNLSEYSSSLNLCNNDNNIQPKIISPITSDISTDCLQGIPNESNSNPWIICDEKNNLFSTVDIKQEPNEEPDNLHALNSNTQLTNNTEEQALNLKKSPSSHQKHVSSPESVSSSPRSLTISFSAVSSADESEDDNTNKSTFCLNENSEINDLTKTNFNFNNSNNCSNKSERTRERKGIPQRLPQTEKCIDDSGPCIGDEYTQLIENENKLEDMIEKEKEAISSPDKKDEHDKHEDLDFQAYRHRNNYSARKCRERRKVMVQTTVTKSLNLEKENNNLRDEVKLLTNEKHQLETLLNKKKEAELSGKLFTPSLIDKLEVSPIKIEVDS